MRWPFSRRVDAGQAWGVIAVGTAGLVGIPTILASLHAADPHFRWWWPTGWMAVPMAIFVIGVGLVALPLLRAERVTVAAPAPAPWPASGPAPLPVPARGRGGAGPEGHAFLCYVHEDAAQVDLLQRDLEAAGISVWRDTADLWPGEDWRLKIRRAITDNALVFIACFSLQSTSRIKSHHYEELTLAVDQLRMRRPDVPWLIPVRLDECEVPDIDVGGGRTLGSLQPADLFGDQRDAAIARVVTVVRRLLAQAP